MDTRGRESAQITNGQKLSDADHMLKQAVYNTAANVCVALGGLGIVALYYVLESFFRPLLWAMLCGAFLHPFKYTVTRNVKNWLNSLKASGTPLAIGTLIVPLHVLNAAGESVLNQVKRRWKVILLVASVFLFLYIIYHNFPMDFRELSAFVWRILTTVSAFITSFSFKWVCALAIAYCLAVIKLISPETKRILGWMSLPIWILLLLCAVANTGTLQVPLVAAVFGFIMVGFFSEDQERQSVTPSIDEHDGGNEVDAEVGIIQQCMNFSANLSTLFMSLSGDLSCENDSSSPDDSASPGDNSSPPDAALTPDMNSPDASQLYDSSPLHDDAQESTRLSQNSPISRVTFRSGDKWQSSRGEFHHDNEKSQPNSAAPSRSSSTEVDNSQSVTDTTGIKKLRRRSDRCFIFLFWSITLVVLWSNVWMLYMAPILMVVLLIKRSVVSIKEYWQDTMVDMKPQLDPYRLWLEQVLSVIVPSPIRSFLHILLKGDRKIIDILLQSADVLITIVFILLLLVGFVVLSFTVSVQVQKEGIHLGTVAINLVQNSTIQPSWLTEYLTNSNDTSAFHSSLDPWIKNVHTFGRQWISNQIAQIVQHESSRRQLENELLGMWDSLYESWVTKNTTVIAKPNYHGALFAHIKEGGVQFMSQNIHVNLSGIISFVRENMGIFQSVLESVWIVLKGNINLAFTVLISSLQIILGGGTAILNFTLSLVVFFTTLFYLLASSSSDYKPVEWISKLTVARAGSKFAQAVEDGIGGVFAATLKMATFYGLYTWLTHTVFGINIVFLPSALAAILGAIPFIGTYWAALPAILELSLIHKEVFLAVLLTVFHILPTFVVDTALYSDIKGGGHPYLTGLAIAGGIYCFGLQGAIVGPVLLCCIIVAMNLYSAMLNPDQVHAPINTGSQANINSRSLHRRTGNPLTRSVSNIGL